MLNEDMTEFNRLPVKLYNSLSRRKEIFEALNPPNVGLYVCGPTVYGDPHVGHARASVTFDIVWRFLDHLGYKVRYVRNITDVGHLENEVDGEGEDKIARKARLEKLEPMEVVQYYSNRYHDGIDALNCRRPSIEPAATAHIADQIGMISKLLDNGLAYISGGTVWFDLEAYAKSNDYGQLSGKVLDELRAGSRNTEGLDEKRNPHDFALWKQADPEHLMRWDSPWGEGFPGWHLECSAMSTRYLGEQFDIHGGGLDLQFPHHEAEIAQCIGANGITPAKYWMHNNMVTIDGAKMSKSAGNFITLDQLYSGEHDLLDQPWHPMVVRFLILQSHYRSQIDFSSEALHAASKGYHRLMSALELMDSIKIPDQYGDHPMDQEVEDLCSSCYEKMCDDFNSAQTLAVLFEMASKINGLYHRQIDPIQLSPDKFQRLVSVYKLFVIDILGLKPSTRETGVKTEKLIELLIEARENARANRDFATSDHIRDQLLEAGVQLKDEKNGRTTFEIIS